MRLRWATRTAIVAALFASSVLLGATPAAADGQALAIGDSVMLGAKWALKNRGIAVDAAVSRQASSAGRLVSRRGDRLPQSVVVHLGTNGTLRRDDCDAVMRQAGAGRTVYWMTIAAKRSWVAGNNRVIRACVRDHPGRASLIDWAWAAGRHPEWLYADGIHLRPAGAKAYARLIADAVRPEPGPATTP